MITQQTLFILGAGASVPYGYKTGSELRKQIINEFPRILDKLLHDDSYINLTERRQLNKDAQKFVDVFEKSSIESIDKFLSTVPSFSYIGKIAIILCILQCEKTGNFREKIDEKYREQDWYTLLFSRMLDGLTEPNDYDKFRENKVSFITFNYDRSFEYFLYESLINSFWDTIGKFEPLIESYIPFPVIHVYGEVDKISWKGGYKYKKNDFTFEEIEKLSKNIRVIGERRNGLDAEINKLIADHNKIMFLGFGYAQENLDALGLPKGILTDYKIYGTTMGMKQPAVRWVKNFLTQNGGPIKFILKDTDCYQLLDDHLK